ncbi:MAG: hypothetical protein FWC01_09610 [Treponema sp.]|nr:hypothetical protein [Treponema sp.]MCL2238197.1 hypothetical protein [Treponema sp.]
MKKFAIILLTACLAGGTLMAQDDEGIGLYLGAELTIGDFEYIDDTMLIRPYVGFEKSFDAVDLYTELGVNIPVYEDAGIGIDFNLGAAYNLSIGDASTLTFGLGTWLFAPFDEEKGMATEYGPYGTSFAGFSYSGLSLHLNISAMFTQTLDFGDLYFGIDVPFILVGDEIDPFDVAELNITAGIETEIGLGAGLTLYNWIGSGNGDFVQNLEIFVTYATGSLGCGVTFGIPLYEYGFDIEGLTITPEIEYEFDFGLSLYLELPIYGLGTDTTTIGLTFGAKFSF